MAKTSVFSNVYILTMESRRDMVPTPFGGEYSRNATKVYKCQHSKHSDQNYNFCEILKSPLVSLILQISTQKYAWISFIRFWTNYLFACFLFPNSSAARWTKLSEFSIANILTMDSRRDMVPMSFDGECTKDICKGFSCRKFWTQRPQY